MVASLRSGGRRRAARPELAAAAQPASDLSASGATDRGAAATHQARPDPDWDPPPYAGVDGASRLGAPAAEPAELDGSTHGARDPPLRGCTPGRPSPRDVKKLGRIPPGGGWRVHGRLGHDSTGVGYDYIHSAVDDHSRVAYSEIGCDERGPTAAAFWTRAVAFFAAHGIVVQRVLTDNAWAYRKSIPFRAAVRESGAVQRFIQPHRPQTNGKVERFNRTLLEEWAYVRPYASNQQRTTALTDWLHIYNHHRAHTSLGQLPPISRLNNVSGHYS